MIKPLLEFLYSNPGPQSMQNATVAISLQCLLGKMTEREISRYIFKPAGQQA